MDNNIKQNILIVDDKETHLYTLKVLLQKLNNIQIIEALSGEEALRKAIKYEFDLAIVDIQMPEMDGYELAQIMRGDKATKEIPIIFVSAIYSKDFHIFKGYSFGAVDFITKPYKPEILLSKVKVFLELKKQKKNLQELVHELNNHKENLQELVEEQSKELIQSEKLSAIGEISASISHELRQPLNLIQLASLYLIRRIQKQKYDEEEFLKRLNEMSQQTLKMSQIMNHMITFCRRTNTDTDTMQLININDTINNTLIIIKKDLTHHNITIHMDLNNELPKIRALPTQLEQVFLNLIINARHALSDCNKSDKKIIIKSYAQKSTSDNSEMIVVELQDNADGMSEEVREKLFQSFFTTKESGKGSGLGLSISKRILDNHNATISVESKIGVGTKFFITFPV